MAQVLSGLDATVGGWGQGAKATAVCVVLEPARGLVRVTNAGHLPLVRKNLDRAELWPGPEGPPLGNPSVRQEVAHALGVDDTLFVFTDGLVERRGRPLHSGLSLLRETAEALPSSDTSGIELVRRTTDQLGQPNDSASLIALRLTAGPGPLARSASSPGGASGQGQGSEPASVVLRVYVDPRDPRSAHTERVVREFANRAGVRVSVQVVDISQSTAQAEADGVIAAPSVLRVLPAPSVQIVGGLRSARELASALELPFADQATAGPGGNSDDHKQ